MEMYLMLTYDQLNAQNDRITELTNVLHSLLSDRFLCDSSVTNELFFRYVDMVKEHLELTDSKLYSQLLTVGDNGVTNTANRFMGGSKEIKRIFARYLKKWCQLHKQELLVKDYDEFTVETKEIFEMVLDRIQDETERLYPLIRQIRGDNKTAA